MTLIQLAKIIKIITGKKTPCDIEKMLEEERYSYSRSEYIKIGDMDLFHFLRAPFDYENKLDKLKKLVEDL